VPSFVASIEQAADRDNTAIPIATDFKNLVDFITIYFFYSNI
jgi:hypothetical protein